MEQTLSLQSSPGLAFACVLMTGQMLELSTVLSSVDIFSKDSVVPADNIKVFHAFQVWFLAIIQWLGDSLQYFLKIIRDFVSVSRLASLVERHWLMVD